MLTTLGARESAAWLLERGLGAAATPHWYVEITLVAYGAAEPAQFELNVYPEEWGFVFRAGRRCSSIRITDQPFVHGSDDHELLSRTPELARVFVLIRELERKRQVTFPLARADVRSNVPKAEASVRDWLRSARQRRTR